MKKIKILTLIAILSFLTVNVSASVDYGKHKQWRVNKQPKRVVQHEYNKPPGTPVGAPIDGGLLVLLAAAGVSYFGVKKKKIEKS